MSKAGGCDHLLVRPSDNVLENKTSLPRSLEDRKPRDGEEPYSFGDFGAEIYSDYGGKEYPMLLRSIIGATSLLVRLKEDAERSTRQY